MSRIEIEVNANVDADAKWILNRQERMEKQRLDFIADLYKYTTNLILTYDEDEVEADGERKDDGN
jgi:hypothetical protein